LLHGEFAISGFSNKALRHNLADQNSAQVSRLLRRLRAFKLIKSAMSH
jgi:hypothetical protein